jgi:hypothetical protein
VAIRADRGLPLKTAPNKFAPQGSLDAMVGVSAGLRGMAVALMKIATTCAGFTRSFAPSIRWSQRVKHRPAQVLGSGLPMSTPSFTNRFANRPRRRLSDAGPLSEEFQYALKMLASSPLA